MAEDIKNLIEKIQQEGFQAAEGKAKEIEERAQRKAQDILAKSKAEAEKLLEEAQHKIKQMQTNTESVLLQAGRDLLLNLRGEIDALLNKLLVLRLRQELTPAELSRILQTLIKNYEVKGGGDITVLLNKEDLEKLEKGFLSEIKEEIKKGIILKSSSDIQAGFCISYDSGKSYYDFTDKALAEYIGTYLKPCLNKILESAASTEKKE
ncbi:hypothetical protein D4R78_02555 [bacterium]|nr:MAG: hypothetical protein D4R78_02555 [bacterium]